MEHLRARIKHECKMQERGNFQGAFAYYHANRARQAGCWVPGAQKQAPNHHGSQGTEYGPPGVRRWVWNPPHAVPTGKAGQTGSEEDSENGRLRREADSRGPPCGGSSSDCCQGGGTPQHRHQHRQPACSPACLPFSPYNNNNKNFHFHISPKFPCTAFHI